jgi:hypothetical protein
VPLSVRGFASKIRTDALSPQASSPANDMPLRKSVFPSETKLEIDNFMLPGLLYAMIWLYQLSLNTMVAFVHMCQQYTIKNTRIMNFVTPIFESWRKIQITRSVWLHGYLRRQKGNILFVHLWYSAKREI